MAKLFCQPIRVERAGRGDRVVRLHKLCVQSLLRLHCIAMRLTATRALGQLDSAAGLAGRRFGVGTQCVTFLHATAVVRALLALTGFHAYRISPGSGRGGGAALAGAARPAQPETDDQQS